MSPGELEAADQEAKMAREELAIVRAQGLTTQELIPYVNRFHQSQLRYQRLFFSALNQVRPQ